MSEGKSSIVTFVNPFSYEVLKNSKISVSKFDFILCDGALLQKLYKIKFGEDIPRISFDYSSIAGDVFQMCEESNLKVALMGGTEGEINLAIENIKNKYSSVDIVYCSHGHFSSDEKLKNAIYKLAEKRPNVVIFGMGTPFQEYALEMYSTVSKVPFIGFSCGGFITQTSLRSDYYYPIVKKLGLRWVQRFVMHSHVRKRVVKYYPKFIVKYLLGSIN
ncbi:WecB/TagA/CpsF family glycosyltransferase [Photobacterium sagamiensis]|uniref:WecB/TagA/CpsF family glycosyltransferase n=1 Tax=Photobacterium sagamiensis TaxID=2910241 RepID=UPI003D13B123